MKMVDLSSYNNSWYKPGSKLRIFLWFIFGRMFVNTYFPVPLFFKILIIRLFGGTIAKGVVLKPKLNIKYPWFLEIGENSWIGEKVWIDNLALVKIGKNVCISQGAMLLTGNHNYKSSKFDLITAGIELNDGVWIGAQSLVGPGVICEENSILSLGSVASGKLMANKIYRGNPAIIVRKREIIE